MCDHTQVDDTLSQPSDELIDAVGNFRGDLLILWVVLIAIGAIMAYYLPDAITGYPYFLYVMGIIVLIAGIIVFIIWLVKVIRGHL